jgi:hypothetical protein
MATVKKDDRQEPGPTNGWRDVKHFKPADFACKCEDLCQPKVMNISMEFVHKLDRLKEELKQPIKINSGCRCAVYNQSVVGGVSTSPHVSFGDNRSCAIDVFVPNAQYLADFLRVALDIGFSGIGLGKTWIHLDDAPRGKPVVWIYPPNKRR